MKVAFIVDDLVNFNIKKDSTYMMFKSAIEKSWDVYVVYLNGISVSNGILSLKSQKLSISDSDIWYSLEDTVTLYPDDLSAIFMRKDPPFDMEYIYVTYALDIAKANGVLVVNNPQALRDMNEKFAISYFPQHSPETIISRDYNQINEFYDIHKDIIAKPLDGMGGSSIFRIKDNDKNKNVILETLTEHQTKYIMVQKYQSEISEGDKRILIVDGEVVDYTLARIPSEADNRGNLAAGASSRVQKLSNSDYKIANDVAQYIKQKGVIFAGIDVIGNKLTEINITSPTGIQEIYKEKNINAAELLMNVVEKKLLNKADLKR